MRLLPAVAAAIVTVIAVVSAIRGDWGVLVISGALFVVAISALVLGRRNEPPPPHSHEPL